jgi:RNA polymerase sigma factor (sigma-70 family)
VSWLGRLAAAPTDADWRRLVGDYGPLLAGWLARAGVPAADRDDLAQDALVIVVREVRGFDRRGAGSFRAWLRRIVANRARAFFRGRRDAPAVDLDQLARDDTALSRLWDREHDEFVVARALRAVEGDFAPATWRAFRLQAIDGRPPAEAAAETGLSLNAAVLAKSRVLKRLRTELDGLVD